MLLDFAIHNFSRINTTLMLLLECTYSYLITRANFSIGQFWHTKRRLLTDLKDMFFENGGFREINKYFLSIIM